MRIIIIAITLFGLTISCKQTKYTQDTILLKYPAFSIEVPKDWKKVDVHGTDSYVGRIAIDSSDTLEFEIGPYSWDMVEYDSIRWQNNRLKYISNLERSDTAHLYDSIEINKVKRSNVYLGTVNGYNSKILIPINPGNGYTGIYIDSLWIEKTFINGIWKTEKGSDGKSIVSKFSLYANNIKADKEKQVLQAIKTLKFHKVK
jgi:hypothetical protein